MTTDPNFDERYTGGGLEPDTVLPMQFFGMMRQNAQLDPERRLMVAVLEDAVNVYIKQMHKTDPKARQLFLDAEEWITTDDPSWFFSFSNVCETLDLDPEYIRGGLLKWKERSQPAATTAGLPAVESAEPSDDEHAAMYRKASGA